MYMYEVPQPKQQVKIIKNILKTQRFEANQKAYAISSIWFNKWKNYIGFDSPNTKTPVKVSLPPIDNGALVYHGVLRPSVIEGQDYEIISANCWFTLKSWYNGGPDIPLDILYDPASHRTVVVTRLMTVYFLFQNNRKEIQISKYKTIGDLKNIACSIVQVLPQIYCFYDYLGNKKGNIYDETKTLSSLSIPDGKVFLLDFLPETPLPLINSAPSSQSSFSEIPQIPVTPEKEICGIKSYEPSGHFPAVLQCLLHIEPLCTFFKRALQSKRDRSSRLSNSELYQSNNPSLQRGVSGSPSSFDTASFHSKFRLNNVTYFNQNKRHDSQSSFIFEDKAICKSFAKIFHDYTSSEKNFISLKSLSDELTQSTSFSFSKPDAYRTLLLFLDYLHEELNIKGNRGPAESISGDGTNDFYVARTASDSFKRKNDSIIADLFYGLIGTKITCSICNTCSSLFSSFLSLTLPLPEPCSITPPFTFIPYDLKEPVQGITLELNGQISTTLLKDTLNAEIGRSFDILIAGYSNGKYEWYSSLHSVPKELRPFVFEIPDAKQLYALAKFYIPGKEQNIESGQAILLQLPDSNPSPIVIQELVENRVKDLWLWDSLQSEELNSNEEEKRMNEEARLLGTKIMEQAGTFPGKKRLAAGALASIFEFRPSFEPLKFSIPVASREIAIILNPSFLNDISRFVWNRFIRMQQPREFHSQPKPVYSLEDRINAFEESILLDSQNQWLCPKCRKYVSAEQKTKVWEFPKIIIFHLKRFFNSSSYLKKNNASIIYPDQINLAQYSGLYASINSSESELEDKSKYNYKLHSVISHSGTTQTGKYTAFSLVKSGQWAKFEGENVSYCDISEAHVEDAYILFYERM